MEITCFLSASIICDELKVSMTEKKCKLARVVGAPVGRRLGDQLATTLVAVATINDIIFIVYFFLSVVYFSHKRNARIKKLI